MKKIKLGWSDIGLLGLVDKSGHWYPAAEYKEYFADIRAPSRAFPHSYAKAAMTIKFFNWLEVNRPAKAKELELKIRWGIVL